MPFLSLLGVLASWRSVLLLTAALSLAVATQTFAQTRPADAIESKPVAGFKTATPGDTGNTVNWQRLVFAMVVVLGLIVALRYAAGWLIPSARAGGGGRGVRVLSRTPIAPRQQVLLLHVGRRVLVVGDSAGTLSSLAAIDEPDEVAELIGQSNTPAASPVASKFKAMFGRAEIDYTAAEAGVSPVVTGPARGASIDIDPEDDGTPARLPPTGRKVEQNIEPADPNIAAAHSEISDLLDRMRSLTKTVRR